MARVTVIIPCYNEEQSLSPLYERLKAVAESSADHYEFLFVNDGSKDETAGMLKAMAEKDKQVQVLHFARNFGHQVAVTAGLDHAAGDVTVIVDADLQDPPEVIPELVSEVLAGQDIVHAQRRKRAGESAFKLAIARLFYWFMKKVAGEDFVENAGDFRAISRRALETARQFREPHRFLRGLFSQLGFTQKIVTYDRDSRYGGETKYSLLKMVRLATDAICSFSAAPVHFITWAAIGIWSVTLLYLIRSLYVHFVLQDTVPGWTSLLVLLSVYIGLVLFCLGILGAYISRIFEQGQRRPLYWIQDCSNLDPAELGRHCAASREVLLSKEVLKGMSRPSAEPTANDRAAR